MGDILVLQHLQTSTLESYLLSYQKLFGSEIVFCTALSE